MNVMYTYQDWLDDKIPVFPNPHSHGPIDIDNFGLRGEMEKEELSKIKKAQQFAYNKSLENNFEHFQKRFSESFMNSPNQKKLLKRELKEIKSEIDQYPREYKKVLNGRKYCSDIRARHYLEINDNSNEFSFLRVNDHCFIELQLLKEVWLKSIKKTLEAKDDTSTISKNNPPKTYPIGVIITK